MEPLKSLKLVYVPEATRKLKACLCARGDKKVKGVDFFFHIFAPVVNWQTIRLMLILLVVLKLSTAQVDNTAAIVHALIDKDPNWDSLSPEEKKKSGVYVETPRGFKTTRKVLKLKNNLYGLKQAPRNFFQHLKGNLEKVGFTSSDTDPCLFISDKAICSVYVDDTLLYSPRKEYIDKMLVKLKAEDMDL
jgi:hypothetical protein